MTLLEVRAVSKRFGQREVLRSLSLEIAQGEFLTILGESGSGKTTLLRLIAGFEQAQDGEILIDGSRIDGLPPFRRPVNTVFQSYALFPHLSVFENVAYGLRAKSIAAGEIPRRVNQALAMVQMSEYAQSPPAKLSGGQQQRVALARALVNRPKLLLLDEPLSALDANLRRQMQTELKALHRQLGITFIFVTHDQEEAMALSDRIALLRAGKLEQVGTPEAIYRNPATAYVADFIGHANLLRGCELRDGSAHWGPLRWKAAKASSDRPTFALRPEEIRLSGPQQTNPVQSVLRFEASVTGRSFEGATELLELSCGKGFPLRARVSSKDGAELATGSSHFFEAPVASLMGVSDEGSS